MPPDRFYTGYSFSVHFGYSSYDEYRRIEKILKESGVIVDGHIVKLSMEFIRDMANQIKKIGSSELQHIKDYSKKEKIVGGIIPPDIFCSSELLRFFLEGIIVGTGEITITYVIKKLKSLSNSKRAENKTYDSLSKMMIKIQKDDNSSDLIGEYSKKFSVHIFNRNLIDSRAKKKFKIGKKKVGRKSKKK